VMAVAPIVSIVVAVSDSDVIGRDNALPWKLSADLQRFKSLTIGKPIIMGRRTWQSIGRPLPGRQNIVITRDPQFVAEGAAVVASFAAALTAAGAVSEVMVIGGAEIYALALPLAQRIHLTRVHGEVQGDTHLRGLDLRLWQEVSHQTLPADERNSHATTYQLFEPSSLSGVTP
jgi:dihydrofolate reductase